jgi:hypothetical protein
MLFGEEKEKKNVRVLSFATLLPPITNTIKEEKISFPNKSSFSEFFFVSEFFSRSMLWWRTRATTSARQNQCMRNWEFVLRYNLDKLFRVEISNESRKCFWGVEAMRNESKKKKL